MRQLCSTGLIFKQPKGQSRVKISAKNLMYQKPKSCPTSLANLRLSWGINTAEGERCSIPFDFALLKYERFTCPLEIFGKKRPFLNMNKSRDSFLIPRSFYWFCFTEYFWWEWRDWHFDSIYHYLMCVWWALMHVGALTFWCPVDLTLSVYIYMYSARPWTHAY